MELNCKFCPLTFKGEIPLKSHFQRVHFYCARCDKKCHNMQDFLLHCKQDHIFNHKCAKCPMKFLSSEELESHDMLNHASLNCEFCQYQGKSKSALQKHLITHSKTREKFLCPNENCEKTYLTRDGLKDHIEAIHNENKNRTEIKCEFCSYKTYRSDNLKHHLKNCGPEAILRH